MVPHRDVAQLFAAADVVVLPSYEEGLPAVICEAMMVGRAVIATPVGGIPEIVRNQDTGLLVTVGDDAALAVALRQVIENRVLQIRLEQNARAFAVQNLTWAVNAESYRAIYEEALDRFHARPA